MLFPFCSTAGNEVLLHLLALRKASQVSNFRDRAAFTYVGETIGFSASIAAALFTRSDEDILIPQLAEALVSMGARAEVAISFLVQ